MAEYRAANKAIVDAAKDVPCAVCGGRFPAVCMDFHHRDPQNKSFNISSKLSGRSPTAIAEEIAKCDVVCANCHRVLTYGRK
jgi:hypothetical protein